MNPVATAAELQKVRSLPRAFVFLWVGWAIQARHSEIAVRELLTAWATEQPGCPAPAFRADLSDQQGEVWEAVRGWLRAQGQPVDPLTFGGYGALLWLRAGSVVASVPNAASVEQSTLVAATRRAFDCLA
jgi:hypothetical protein